MWDERVVAAIVKAAKEDLQQQKWARDFADKLRQRGITTEQVLRTASLQSFIVLYWHKERVAIGFWHPDIRLVAVWSPLRKGRWVTAF
jgi:hypothetical protein